MGSRTVAVVGSGAAGLGAGFRLHQAGYEVRMFESNGYVGGRMKTLHRDGFVIDEGATSIPENYSAMLGVIRDAGLADRLDKTATTFAFPRDGRLHVASASIRSRAARSPARSGSGARRPSFDYVVNPSMGCISGDVPDKTIQSGPS